MHLLSVHMFVVCFHYFSCKSRTYLARININHLSRKNRIALVVKTETFLNQVNRKRFRTSNHRRKVLPEGFQQKCLEEPQMSTIKARLVRGFFHKCLHILDKKTSQTRRFARRSPLQTGVFLLRHDQKRHRRMRRICFRLFFFKEEKLGNET